MRGKVLPSLVLGGAILCLSSCSSDGSRATDTSVAFSPPGPGAAIIGGNPACGNNAGQPSGQIVDSVPAPPNYGIAVRDDGLTYFTESFNNGIGITSTKTRTIDGFIPTDAQPIGVAFSPDGGTAYETNLFGGTVGVIDVATSTVIGSIFTPAGAPLVVRVSLDGSQLFIATASTTVYIVDTQTLQITGSVDVGFLPNAFAVHPDGRIIYVSAAFGGTVHEIDRLTGIVLRTFTVGGIPQDMAVTRKADRLYVANDAGYLSEINLLSGQVTASIPLLGGAFGLGVTPNDGQAYISIHGLGKVQVFNLQSRTLARTINVGGDPRRIAFSQQGHIGAIANLAGYLTFVR
jgi:YVTN family beta-propeller protein